VTTTDSNNAEVTAIDTSARGPLLLLLGSGLKWLVISGLFGLIASIQLFTPSFFASSPFLTHGRVVALAETAFVYGWAANAGLGIALWVLGRLGGEPLRALNWVVGGTYFWNIGLTLGCIGIATGDATSFSRLELPHYVLPLMVVAYAAIAVSGVLAWWGRRTDLPFASQWYGVAALFLFPWLLTAAYVVLFCTPVRGTVQAVAAGWFSQGAWTLWLAPLALSGAYYIVPKVTGRSMPAYEFAPLGFWTLIVFGAWTGGRHLIGGPVPAWISTIGIVSCTLMLFHYLIAALNFRLVWCGTGTALKFISFGLVAYFLGGLLDAVASYRSIAVVTQFTHFADAQQQLALYGGISMMFYGAIYFAVPRLSGRAWASSGLLTGHRVAAKLGVVLLVVCLGIAGWIQGSDLNNAKVTFAEIAAHVRPWLLGAAAAQALLLLGNLMLLVNFWRSACFWFPAPASAQAKFIAPATMEASVS
jgi:cytochrome c oxidase cbb3-type subunit I